MMAENNIVFVSEYAKAPKDARLVYKKEIGLTGQNGRFNFAKKRKRSEKLYVL
jgi:hypothetical protein